MCVQKFTKLNWKLDSNSKADNFVITCDESIEPKNNYKNKV